MKKVRAKYLISLCIFLLSFNTQSIANTYIKNSFYSNKHLKSTASDSQLQKLNIITKAVSSKSSDRLFINEKEEKEETGDESFVSKKRIFNTFFSSSLFYISLNNFLLKIKQALLSYKQFSNLLSSCLFIVFGVFKI
ncbi:hypothetical protein [Emticicia sp. SJ17W-69]|uniref:hypothetical protein n=1 Tax=Emticicia sp. SJ17W-69 TaxID=3421657 RepID=UPI003EBF51E8